MGGAILSESTKRTAQLSGIESRAIVLVGFAEALSAPEVLWSLVDGGFRVIAFSRRGRRSALRHSHHVVVHEISAPESNLQAALGELQTLMASISAPLDGAERILFPLDDTAVWLCSRVELGGEWISAGPNGHGAELALNKQMQAELASEAGFNVPATTIARTAKELIQCCDGQSFPVILRPIECLPTQDGHLIPCGKWICANRREVERAAAEWAECTPLLVQPFISGTGEGVFGLAAPDGIRAWSAHRRIRMMNPQGSGSSACVSQPVQADVRQSAERLIEKSSWQGLFMIELLRDASGKVWFVELNGRPWGSMALSRRQGLEYPAWHVTLAVDPRSQAGDATTAAPGIVCKHMGRELMHLLFVLRGPKSKALRNWPSFWRTMGSVLNFRRGDTVYNWRREDPKVFIADCCYTLHGNLFKSRN